MYRIGFFNGTPRLIQRQCRRGKLSRKSKKRLVREDIGLLQYYQAGIEGGYYRMTTPDCFICDQPFTEQEWENRHTLHETGCACYSDHDAECTSQNVYDIHERCCPTYNEKNQIKLNEAF
jgi:hypothetical protein